MNRRISDRPDRASTGLGILLIVAGLALKILAGQATSEWFVIALVLVGGVLVRGESVTGLLRAWRRNNGTPPAAVP